MSNGVIRVENLGKRYIIGHQKRERYTALRDVIADGTKSLAGRLLKPFGTKIPDPAVEEFWALKDVSFEINRGDRVGIIGRNGAGKSTLLKILSRITEPTTGRIAIKGRVASLLEVGTGFHPELTGRENIYLNGAILGMSKAEIKKKFDEMVVFAEVEKFLDTPVKRYSSGMYVRLAFAVAAHLEPEILVVDEVLAVGDVEFQKKCLGKMQDVAEKEGRTVLFVSHNLTAIRTLCSRGILLDKGKIVADSSADEAVRTYLSYGGSNILVREWNNEIEAPQNNSIVLRKISICDEQDNQVSQVYTDTRFNIKIEFSIKEDNSSAGLTVIFYDDENKCILGSINNHEPNWYGKSMPKGNYKSICKIPANFFNNGLFNLSINIFGKNFSDQYMAQEVLRLEILDGGMVRRDYYGNYEGAIRPLFDWITTKN